MAVYMNVIETTPAKISEIVYKAGQVLYCVNSDDTVFIYYDSTIKGKRLLSKVLSSSSSEQGTPWTEEEVLSFINEIWQDNN